MTLLRRTVLDNTMLEFHTNPAVEVDFIDGMEHPLRTITKLTQGYSGKYDNDDVSSDDVDDAFRDLNSTKLQTPYETVAFVFLLKRVTRSFTHQLVRTRMGAAYVQESMRFLGYRGTYRFLVGKTIVDSGVDAIYTTGCTHAIQDYEAMMNAGASSEDARDILPHGIMTAVFVGYTLSSLQRVYTQRMCCQAQPGQWQLIVSKMKKLLVEHYGDDANKLLSAPFERGEPCGYRASFDRPCIWQKDKA